MRFRCKMVLRCRPAFNGVVAYESSRTDIERGDLAENTLKHSKSLKHRIMRSLRSGKMLECVFV